MDADPNRWLLLDGATGSNLIKAGMPAGVSVEKWILENPDVLTDLQKAFVSAGSQAVLAPTFSANKVKLSAFSLGDKVAEYNKKLVELSRNAVGNNILVGGDISPTGLFIEPYGEATFDELLQVYREQTMCLKDAGVDFIFAETLMSMTDARACLIAARETGLPVYVSVTTEKSGRTMTGFNPLSALVTLQSLGASAVGLNCSTGPDDMTDIIKELALYAKVPLITKPNASLPGSEIEPKDYAASMKKLVEAGARIVGGCCGTTPEHIAKTKAELETITDLSLPEIEDVRAAANEREVFFLNEDNIEYSEMIECSYDLADDLIDIEDEGINAALVNVTSIEDAHILAENAHMSRLPIAIHADSASVLDLALLYYQGRAIVDSRCEINDTALKLTAEKYGAIIY